MKARGLEAGFTDLLTKPIRKATLLEALVEHRIAEVSAGLPGGFVSLRETPEEFQSLRPVQMLV